MCILFHDIYPSERLRVVVSHRSNRMANLLKTRDLFLSFCKMLLGVQSTASRPVKPTSLAEAFAMPRQPLKRVIPLQDRPQLFFGIACPEKRPALAASLGKILLAWPHVESHMAVVLGLILGADSEPSLAVYEILRRSSSQREAIEAAAKIKLSPKDVELLAAILNVHKSIEADRNAFAHGHIGWTDKLPDALLWITTADYIRFALRAHHGILDLKSDGYDQLADRAFVYSEQDLTRISNEVRDLWRAWIDLNTYLAGLIRFEMNDDEAYNRLCGQPRIAQELATLRQKNSTAQLQ